MFVGKIDAFNILLNSFPKAQITYFICLVLNDSPFNPLRGKEWSIHAWSYSYVRWDMSKNTFRFRVHWLAEYFFCDKASTFKVKTGTEY